MMNNFIKKILTILFLIFIFACKNKDNKILRVGIDANYFPFEYHENNKIVGWTIDMNKKKKKRINKKIVFKEMIFKTLLVALQNDNIDCIISSMTITEERKKYVNFTQSYFMDELSLIVKEDNRNIKSIDDLKNKKVGSTIGTSGYFVAKNIKNVAENIEFNESPETYLNLIGGKIDAAILHRAFAEQAIKANGGAKIIEDSRISEKTQSEWGIAVNKNNPNLLKELNKTLTSMKKDGFFKKLNDKYF